MHPNSKDDLPRTKTINLTPSNYGVPVEVAPLRKEGLHQQREQIETLDEEPEVVGHDAVMEENHHCFAAHLQEGRTERDSRLRTGLDPFISCST